MFGWAIGGRAILGGKVRSSASAVPNLSHFLDVEVEMLRPLRGSGTDKDTEGLCMPSALCVLSHVIHPISAATR